MCVAFYSDKEATEARQSQTSVCVCVCVCDQEDEDGCTGKEGDRAEQRSERQGDQKPVCTSVDNVK
jgi:hypothetical protein